MKSLSLIAACLCGALLASGCVSVVRVQRATENSVGIRYSLPQVFIQVTPADDGSVTVETIYVPDPNEEYVITADSYLGSYTLDVNRNDKGFLETVSFNSDSTGIAKQLITSQATVRAADIDAKAAKAKVDATEAKTAADKVRAAVDAADKARKDGKVALDVAISKRKLLEDFASQPGAAPELKGQITTARLAEVEAQTKYEAAVEAYNTLATNVEAANGLKGANSSGPQRKAPTPAFYRVDMRAGSVALVEAFPQKDLVTWKVPEALAMADPLLVLPVAQPVRPAEKTKALTAVVKANQAMLAAGAARFAPKGPGAKELAPPLVSLLSDRVTLAIELPPDLPSGDYELDLDVKTGKSTAPIANTVALVFRVIK